MEMWLRQAIIVSFAVAVAGMVISPQFSVTLDQTQKNVDVPVGSSLILCCRLRIMQCGKFRVSWYFNPSGCSFSDSQNLSDKVITQSANTSSNKAKDGLQEIEETYSLSNITHENSGWYLCKVTIEIPIYRVYNSNGTQVNITSKNIMEITTYPSLMTSEQANPSVHGPVISWWMWIILGVSAFILLVLLVICILLRRKCHTSKEPDPIYINTRPMVNKQPSPRLSMSVDNLKMAPASQNLRTPSPGRRYEEGKRKQRR